MLTGAGTVWYDVVCNIWLAAKKPARCRIVIRPGCYITHDRGIYDIAQKALVARDPIACDLGGDLTSALELMAMVQSVPEADRAVVNFGKRDCAFDAGLPQPVARYRNGAQLSAEDRERGDYGPALYAAPRARQRRAGRRYSGVRYLASVPDV